MEHILNFFIVYGYRIFVKVFNSLVIWIEKLSFSKRGQLFSVNYENILKGCGAAEQFETFDPIMKEGLEKCVPALTKNNCLKPMGRILHCYRIQAALKSRALLRNYLSHNPQLFQEPIFRPVFIIGLPRTGTTHLYHLLSQDHRFKAPLTWELNFPSPSPTGKETLEDSRVTATKNMYGWYFIILKYTHLWSKFIREPRFCFNFHMYFSELTLD